MVVFVYYSFMVKRLSSLLYLFTGQLLKYSNLFLSLRVPGNFASFDDITSLPNLLNDAGYKTGIIGKYHVGPQPNYNFTYGLGDGVGECWAGAATCTNTLPGGYNMAARNITNMKLNARTFLNDIEPEKPFFLYVGFGDCHRCGEGSATGAFCEKFGVDAGRCRCLHISIRFFPFFHFDCIAIVHWQRIFLSPPQMTDRSTLFLCRWQVLDSRLDTDGVRPKRGRSTGVLARQCRCSCRYRSTILSG